MDWIQHAIGGVSLVTLCGIYFRLGSLSRALRDHAALDRELFESIGAWPLSNKVKHASSRAPVVG